MMRKDDFKGYFIKGEQLKNRNTNRYETVTVLYDGNKVIGVFHDITEADQWWKLKYIPSGRTELVGNRDKWE